MPYTPSNVDHISWRGDVRIQKTYPSEQTSTYSDIGRLGLEMLNSEIAVELMSAAERFLGLPDRTDESPVIIN